MDLTKLNPAQREAVCTLSGPLLVLAGAGSGKTRVLTYRIANLIENGVAPWNILALTFTNKAAREMKERTEKLVGENSKDMWVTTFHSCCARILRYDIDKLGYEKTFLIYDDADQMSVVNDIIKQMNLPEDDFPKRWLRERIGDAKNKSPVPEEYFRDDAWRGDTLYKAYKLYQSKLKAANALDFDDLLLKTVELFEKYPDVLEKYRNKFRHVLVDEYQDTNIAQYRLVRLLCKEHGNICVVGDDDQSIYGWRGADIRNILGFEQDFPGTKVVRLEQNYRSTNIILSAANGVIENNQSRKRKTLWTAKQGGDRIEYYSAPNERFEADFICRKTWIFCVRR
jgi:DNA helicase-2/ATP-dependent DNA helicase PcrA